jgi:flagella basal body P-ring formation protein FlgA
MLPNRCFVTIVALILVANGTLGAEPVVVKLRAQNQVQSAVVTIGDIAVLSGGDAVIRERIAHLDVADLKPREQTLSITRRVVEYRLLLAGIDPSSLQITGDDSLTIAMIRRNVTKEEVVAAARTELIRKIASPPESVSIELARPVVVQLPEVPAGDPVTIAAIPHAKYVGPGRVQMDVVISAAGERLLGLGVDFEVKPIGLTDPAAQIPNKPVPVPPIVAPGRPMPPPAVPPGTTPTNSTSPIIQPRQRVTMLVHSGGLNVTAVGEAQQQGRLGQVIPVQNVDSKKTVNARVSGPGTVEIDLDVQQQ